MEQYDQLDKILSKRIMESTSHQFIYGYDGFKRANFLKLMAEGYPISAANEKIVGLYINDRGLVKKDEDIKNLDPVIINDYTKQYYDFLIASSVVDKIIEETKDSKSDINLDKFVQHFKGAFVKKDKEAATLRNISFLLKNGQISFVQGYYEYMRSGQLPNLSKNSVISINLTTFISFIRDVLAVDNPLYLIFDNQQSMSLKSQETINTLIKHPSSSGMVVKVGCEIQSWGTYHTLDDQRIKNNYDYREVNLDDSHQQYLRHDIRQYVKNRVRS
jgi:hypothetical protein